MGGCRRAPGSVGIGSHSSSRRLASDDPGRMGVLLDLQDRVTEIRDVLAPVGAQGIAENVLRELPDGQKVVPDVLRDVDIRIPAEVTRNLPVSESSYKA